MNVSRMCPCLWSRNSQVLLHSPLLLLSVRSPLSSFSLPKPDACYFLPSFLLLRQRCTSLAANPKSSQKQSIKSNSLAVSAVFSRCAPFLLIPCSQLVACSVQSEMFPGMVDYYQQPPSYHQPGYDYTQQEEEWDREGLLDPAWEKQQKKVGSKGSVFFTFRKKIYATNCNQEEKRECALVRAESSCINWRRKKPSFLMRLGDLHF